jgi:hypothetical protein
MLDWDGALPRALGDGLVLRQATAADADALAEFNVRLHSDNPDEPEHFLGYWTRDLLSGSHPTTCADDVTVVVDSANGGRIVSTSCLISQTWQYEDVPFGCGRIELVATDAHFRCRGLVRAQFEALHARSAAKGERVQVITGIPWYYRQFGYEMAMDLDASRLFVWSRPGNLSTVEQEEYRLRPATVADIPVLARLYAVHCRAGMVSRLRDEAQWRFEMEGVNSESLYHRAFRIVETTAGEPVAYAVSRPWPPVIFVNELGVAEGHPWRPVLAFLARTFKAEADAHNGAEPGKPLLYVQYYLGTSHPVYDALDGELEPPGNPYTWYVRVADVPGFLHLIAPVLERRLASSVMAGHTGTLRLSSYVRQLTLVFERGRLMDIGTYQPADVTDADALFPDLTFLQLLFGHRDLADLRAARADCYARSAEARVLLGVLFPRRPSSPAALG